MGGIEEKLFQIIIDELPNRESVSSFFNILKITETTVNVITTHLSRWKMESSYCLARRSMIVVVCAAAGKK